MTITKELLAALKQCRAVIENNIQLGNIVESANPYFISEVRSAIAKAESAVSEPATLAKAWADGYRLGVADERTSEANIGIAGFDAKVKPARNNPYGTPSAAVSEPVAWRTQAAIWLRRKANEQQAINKKYPRHVECYPSWETKVRDLNWLADDLEREQESAPYGLDATPAEAKPLTDDKVREIYGRDLMDYRDGDYMRFARAIEQAHNIGAKE